MMRNAAVIALVVLGVFALEVRSECPSTRKCRRRFNPVCDNNGKEYANKCSLRMAKDCDASLSRGKCPVRNCNDRQCDKTLKPVCGIKEGDNGASFLPFNNACLLKAAIECDSAIKFLNEGMCPQN